MTLGWLPNCLDVPWWRFQRSIGCTVKPGKKVRLKDHDTGWAQTKELKELGKDVVKDRAKEILDENLEDLALAQELLYADGRYAVLSPT